MRLYLVQHGEAFSEEQDPVRPLTEKGKSDSLKSVQFLKNAGLSVDAIWHSQKKRSIETAQIFQDILSATQGLQQQQGLSPNDPVDKIFTEIQAQKQSIMIVGHLPFLAKLASLILIGHDAPQLVKFSMGGVVALEKDAEGNRQIVFQIVSDLLK